MCWICNIRAFWLALVNFLSREINFNVWWRWSLRPFQGTKEQIFQLKHGTEIRHRNLHSDSVLVHTGSIILGFGTQPYLLARSGVMSSCKSMSFVKAIFILPEGCISAQCKKQSIIFAFCLPCFDRNMCSVTVSSWRSPNTSLSRCSTVLPSVFLQCSCQRMFGPERSVLLTAQYNWKLLPVLVYNPTGPT